MMPTIRRTTMTALPALKMVDAKDIATTAARMIQAPMDNKVEAVWEGEETSSFDLSDT